MNGFHLEKPKARLQMDKFIEKLIEKETLKLDVSLKHSSMVTRCRVNELPVEVVKSLLTQAMQAQREACVKKVFRSKFGRKNFCVNDRQKLTEIILNAKVEE